MMSIDEQTEQFKQGEADAWFARNADYLAKKKQEDDYLYPAVLRVLEHTHPEGFAGKEVLEVGCANGYRLNWIKQAGGKVTGIDPGKGPIDNGIKTFGFSQSELQTIDGRSFFKDNGRQFDIILFAHSLYLVPPAELPSNICGAIDALREGGFIFVYDFDSTPQRQAYHHAEGLWSYKTEYDRLFTGFPQMKLLQKEVFEHGHSLSSGNPKEDCALSVIRKIPLHFAYPQIEGAIINDAPTS